MTHWTLACSACSHTAPGDALASVCPDCGQPYLVRYATYPMREAVSLRWDMWRYAAALPIARDEEPISLGEGATPLLECPALAAELGVRRLRVKDEGLNPTASFKARGMSAAVTRAKALGVPGLVAPTAGNAGAALAAYGAAARLPVCVYAPEATPKPILDMIRAFGAHLELVSGHIGDAGKAARAFASESKYFDMSTLREPYRIEGKKTMGMELAEQMGWTLPDVVVYPTGGGTGLIGMWKVFGEMRDAGWFPAKTKFPRMITAQADGCAPIVRAFAQRRDRAEPWDKPTTHAAGLRVPAPLGDRLILRALAESHGDAGAATEDEIRHDTARLAHMSGINAAPEGGCAVAVTRSLCRSGRISPDADVVIFNTGSGASYRF